MRLGLYAAFSFLICWEYLFLTRILPEGVIANEATFQVAWPFKARFLVPWLLAHILPIELLGQYGFRMAFCSVVSFVCFLLIGAYARRLRTESINPVGLAVCLFAVMMSHYGVSRWDNWFLIYDFPSIAAYMAVFLLLTASRRIDIVAGAVAAIIASLNRETILIALFHACIFWYIRMPKGFGYAAHRVGETRRAPPGLWPIAAICGTGLVILGIRAIVVSRLGGHASDMYSLYEDGMFRLVSNVLSVMVMPPAGLSILLFGCGMILWLPAFAHRLSPLAGVLMRASLMPFCGLIIVGNFTELRVYNEFVPLLAVGLYQAIGQAGNPESA